MRAVVVVSNDYNSEHYRSPVSRYIIHKHTLTAATLQGSLTFVLTQDLVSFRGYLSQHRSSLRASVNKDCIPTKYVIEKHIYLFTAFSMYCTDFFAIKVNVSNYYWSIETTTFVTLSFRIFCDKIYIKSEILFTIHFTVSSHKGVSPNFIRYPIYFAQFALVFWHFCRTVLISFTLPTQKNLFAVQRLKIKTFMRDWTSI